MPFLNSVHGLRAGHETHIAPLVAWYREHGSSPRFEIVPGLATLEICRELARHGFAHSGFHASLIGRPDATAADHELLALERVSRTTLDEFLETHASGWSVPDPQGFKVNTRGWIDQPEWSLYLAHVGDH